MPETLLEPTQMVEAPDISHIITEDGEPVDNLFSEKQQRLLVESLYSSWNPGQPFIAAANVGIFNSPYQPPMVPDMFLSLDVQADEDLWKKENRSYFVWKFGKPPEVVVEIVSNTKGGESAKKFRAYARIGVWYYIIFDPQRLIQEGELCIYQLSLGRYVMKHDQYLEQIGLGLTLWDGVFEGLHERWLRWCDAVEHIFSTGMEGKRQEQQRAEQQWQRAERLAAQLRALGVEPDNGAQKP